MATFNTYSSAVIDHKLSKKANTSSVPTKVSDLTNDAGFINNTVNNLTNYYTKSQTYTQTEINALVSSIPRFAVQVVSTLPTTDISTTTIYLLRHAKEDTNNLFDEYIYQNNAWELLGTASLDLSNYATLDTTGLTNYTTTTALTQLLGTKADTEDVPTKTSDLTNDSGFTTVSASTYTDSDDSTTISNGIITISN